MQSLDAYYMPCRWSLSSNSIKHWRYLIVSETFVMVINYDTFFLKAKFKLWSYQWRIATSENGPARRPAPRTPSCRLSAALFYSVRPVTMTACAFLTRYSERLAPLSTLLTNSQLFVADSIDIFIMVEVVPTSVMRQDPGMVRSQAVV